jgi:hypothetical protein
MYKFGMLYSLNVRTPLPALKGNNQMRNVQTVYCTRHVNCWVFFTNGSLKTGARFPQQILITK